jgi:hypothetical protein
MTSGADLFVVCKQCGSEVSPYITECPYCGHRLRRRAPKLPRPGEQPARSRRPHIPGPSLGRLRRGEIVGVRPDSPPYATVALVAAACAVWVAVHVRPLDYLSLLILGPLHGDWWRLATSQFVYLGGFYGGLYQFVALLTVGLFGWLLERRHGPYVVLLVFFGAGISGALATVAVYPIPEMAGANAAALGLLAAWAVPDVQALRGRFHYEGDLLGVAALAAVLLAMPLARPEASFVAGVVGGVVGLVVGFGLSRLSPD